MRTLVIFNLILLFHSLKSVMQTAQQVYVEEMFMWFARAVLKSSLSPTLLMEKRKKVSVLHYS